MTTQHRRDADDLASGRNDGWTEALLRERLAEEEPMHGFVGPDDGPEETVVSTKNEAAMEIGCPHRFGIVHQCPTCGSPRHLSTSDHVTDRYLAEVERGERGWLVEAVADRQEEPATDPKWWPHEARRMLRDAYRTRNTVNGKTFDEILDAVLAEREARSTETAPLDVELLRKAIENVDNSDPLDFLDDGDVIDAYGREYRRLSRQPSTEPAQGGTDRGG